MFSAVEYDQRQTPYIVFPKEQVNATVIAGSSLTLGPIVVKNLNVDNIYALGSWCLYSDGVMKCCNFDLEPVLDRTGAALISSCVGGLEEWRLLRSLDCESGLVEYSLFKAGVRVNDSGQYVYTVTSDIGYMFNYAMDVRVNRVSILSSLPVSPEIATVISTFTTLLIVIPVAVLIIVLVGSIVASWSRKAQRKEVFLREAVAECEAVGPVQMAGVFIHYNCLFARVHCSESCLMWTLYLVATSLKPISLPGPILHYNNTKAFRSSKNSNTLTVRTYPNCNNFH